ncbi:uncharacterized protein LOC136086241 [Hydra vulgaris]|uniref:Uncharacterized protein LOC136086241 n=1 Tax=Hydra vulgaris TaxID=6087 RepID=A0ABM4CRT6_HYDVU
MIVNRDQFDYSTVLTSHVLKVASNFNREQVLIKNDLNLLWDDSKISESDKIVYENFQKNIKFNGLMYEVELPFKTDHPVIGDNYNLCKSRFLALEKKLASDRDLFASYNNIIKDQLSKGIIEKVSNFESNIGDVHYLPHRPVIREDKLTSKVRIVFDASACTSGPSLNECLFSGPSLTTSLYSILLRFRAKRIAIIADIEKAFLNIALAEKHRDFVRFLWYKDLFDLDNNNLKSADLSVYRLCRVLFGVTSSPFLLSATLINHAKHYAANDFEFSKKLIQSLHVDDFNASFDSVAEGLLFYNKAKSCLREGNFYLRKFESNSMELNSLIKEDNPTSSDITKVLGLKWDKIEDNFIFSFQDLLYLVHNKPSKRSILKFIASFYDPLGLVNPIIVRCKILFQSICKLKLGWNSLIGDDILIEWNDIINDLGLVPFICVPRWYSKCVDNIQNIKFELYGFCDASLKAYGCCIYLRSSAEGVANSCLVTSKSRVSPLLKNTIPKLELRAMLLLANLFIVVYKELSCVLNISCIKLFSDSIICLNWVNNVNKKYEAFVQKRLEKIRSLYDINFWSYIESERNPADIISRGCRFSTFQKNDLWFKGPSFLFNDFISWPSFDLSKQGDSLSEVATLITSEHSIVNLDFMNIKNFKTYDRLLKVTALVLRFVRIIKKEFNNDFYTITTLELNNAELLWIKFIQKSIFNSESYNQLKRDLGFFTVNELIRCKGRLSNAPIPFDSKFPIYLPIKSYFSNLIILHYHYITKHGGVKETLNELRTKFWLSKSRSLIKTIIRNCHVCRRFDSKPYIYPNSPPLPLSRVSDKYAFKYVGVDLCGPIMIKNIYESNMMYKAWIFVATCCSTRFLYLDLVPDCSAEACIRGLRRFISRFGAPLQFISDNGSNFSAEETQSFTSLRRIRWCFNVPAAPWWGGVFERMIRTTKRVIKKVLGTSRVTYEEMTTILAEIVVTINNRPITFLYDVPGDEPLTPNHLVFGRKLPLESANLNNLLPTDQFDDKQKYLHQKAILDFYWHIWKGEYLTSLRELHKSVTHRSWGFQMKVGDVVIIDDPKVPRSVWKMGIIQRLRYSNDGQVRAAEIRVISGDRSVIIKRTANKLYLLERHYDIEEQSTQVTFVSEKNIEILKNNLKVPAAVLR